MSISSIIHHTSRQYNKGFIRALKRLYLTVICQPFSSDMHAASCCKCFPKLATALSTQFATKIKKPQGPYLISVEGNIGLV